MVSSSRTALCCFVFQGPTECIVGCSWELGVPQVFLHSGLSDVLNALLPFSKYLCDTKK
jgi:hypothetical protein